MESALRVISNTTPLINFAEIDQLDVLRTLYRQIFIPDAVVTELREKCSLFPKAANVPDLDFVHIKEPGNEALVWELTSFDFKPAFLSLMG